MCEIKKIKNQHKPSNSDFKQMDIRSANYFNSVERLRVLQNITEWKLDQKKIINEVQKKEYFVCNMPFEISPVGCTYTCQTVAAAW